MTEGHGDSSTATRHRAPGRGFLARRRALSPADDELNAGAGALNPVLNVTILPLGVR